MEKLTHESVVVMFLALGTLLVAARLLGETARLLNQPAVLGEIIAGLLLGPAVLGRVLPDLNLFLFPKQGPNALVLDGFTTLSIALFLLVAGMEADLSRIWKQGRLALLVSAGGLAMPFTLGFLAAWFAGPLLGWDGGSHLAFALFIATALAISALPVIAKTLMDLYLYKSDIGMTIVAAAIIDDLVGWIIFGVILGMIGASGSHDSHIGQTVLLTLLYAGGILTVGRWAVNKALPFLEAYASWPGGVLGFALGLALFGAAFTEWIGIHAIFGSYLVGMAIGDSPRLRQQTRTTIEQFISTIFAPIFFASIGLKVDFLKNFDLGIVLAVLVIACVGKVLGCGLAARLGGMRWPEAWAVGFGMNARGAMEIILGLLALQAGLINEKIFVALVVMALVTSLISGPMMKRLLGLSSPRRFYRFMAPGAFLHRVAARSRKDAIRELAEAVARVAGLDPVAVQNLALSGEEIAPTGIAHGVAVPHAKVDGLPTPIVGVALSRRGIDFDAPDGEPARIIFLVLTPVGDDRSQQLRILADIAAMFNDPDIRESALKAETFTEFLAVVRYAEESFTDVSQVGHWTRSSAA